MAVSASFLLMQAVPTLLSCLAFSSFSPLFFVGSVPFSVLFVSLSVLISVASWCWSPHDGVFPAEETDLKYRSIYNDCSRVSSKQGTRSWWCCGEAPRGFQLAMLFFTWALLFLLLCKPPMANAESKVQLNMEQLRAIGDEPAIDVSSEGVISEVIWKDSNQVETASHSSDSGPLRRQEDDASGQGLNNDVEELISRQSSFDSSVGSGQFGLDLQRPASDDKVELQSCRALVRAGQQVTCGPRAHPASGDGISYFRDCSMVFSDDMRPSLRVPYVAIIPSQLDWVQQPLYQRQVSPLTIINSCNGSRLSLLAVVSDNRQFFVTGFSEKHVAPGGTLTFPVCYLPQYMGAASGRITIETSADPLVVQLQGEGVASPYQMHVRVHGKSHYVLSVFNPFNETMFVEEVVVSPEEYEGLSEDLSSKENADRVSESTLNDIVIEAEEGSHDDESSKHGLLMRAGATWELPAQASRDIVEFNIVLKQGEVFRGAFQIRVTGAALGSKGDTLVYPFSSRVSQPSPVLSVPDTVDFGMLVGDQARSQPLVLQNSGDQLVQVEEIYEVPADPRIAIDYKKGRVLLPGSETEIANVTYRGLNQPHAANACSGSQKIMVRTNSTIGHLIGISYTAVVLQCLDCKSSPPDSVYVPKSTARAVGHLRFSHAGQGIGTLIMDYGVFFGLLSFGIVVGVVFFFQVLGRDTVLPTSSGDLSKGGSHRRSSSRGSPFIKKRDKLLKMWGWGALATVIDGLWAAFGSAIWRKDCSASSPDYSLPRSVISAQTPAQTGAQTVKSVGGAGASGSGSLQAAGRKGSSDKKNNSVAKSDQTRNGKGSADTGSLPVTAKDPHHHPPSIKQPKSSKFLRPENPSAKHTICMEDSVEDSDSVVKDGVVAPVVQVVALAPNTDVSPDLSVRESPKKALVAEKTQSASACAQSTQPTQPPQLSEREKRKRRKKPMKQDVAANLSTNGGTSPASPASPVTPTGSAWSVNPLSPAIRKPAKSTSSLSDQSTASLSPKSSGSAEHVDAVPLPKLKVKVLNSLKTLNPAPVGSGTESPRRNLASAPLQQSRQQGRVADRGKQPLVERNSGFGAKKGNSSEYAAVARRKTPNTGHNKGVDATDGGHSYRGSRYPHRGANAFAASEDGLPALTASASFPRRSSRPTGWISPSFEFGVGERIDPLDATTLPSPAIAPALRAPGARITKPASTGETSSLSNAVGAGWSSLGFITSPEVPDRELGPGSPWHPSNSLAGQTSEELVYDIWGNHFGNLSQCSSSHHELTQASVFDKEVDFIKDFHHLLVPNHPHSEVSYAGTGGFLGDTSPTAQALYASFTGLFSDSSTLGAEDSRPASPASELPDQLYSDSPPAGFSRQASASIGAFASAGRPRVRVPYSPPMGTVSHTAFSSAAFSSPLSTPTSVARNSSCSFWAHDNSHLPERALSPTLSLT